MASPGAGDTSPAERTDEIVQGSIKTEDTVQYVHFAPGEYGFMSALAVPL